MPEIHALEAVDLRDAWPNEAQDFTPWLVEHLELLGAELELDLKFVDKEVTLPGAGRVDILAQQTRTGATVVIENQLESSDDSHLLRLLGYAADRDASILVWVARDFTNYHRSILEWLNASDTINVYAVTVKAHQVGDAFAASFRTVLEPPQAQPGTSSASQGKHEQPLCGILPAGGGQTPAFWAATSGEGRLAGPVSVFPDRIRRCNLRRSFGTE